MNVTLNWSQRWQGIILVLIRKLMTQNLSGLLDVANLYLTCEKPPVLWEAWLGFCLPAAADV
jgi:hypothetical protein